MSYTDWVESELRAFRIELPQPEVHALSTYCSEVARWNRKINLTSLSGEALVRRLVAEPVWIARELVLQGTLLDVGSGNGSPGLPFSLVSPLRACHLVEARTKKAAFLRHLVAALALPGVVVHRAKFEEIASTLPSPDWISLQAVALTARLAGSLRQIAHPTTTIVWITSADTPLELEPIRSLTVPVTGTRVLLFQLDLS